MGHCVIRRHCIKRLPFNSICIIVRCPGARVCMHACMCAHIQECAHTFSTLGVGAGTDRGNQTGTHRSERGFSEGAKLSLSPPGTSEQTGRPGGASGGPGRRAVPRRGSAAWAAGRSTPCSSAGREGRASWGGGQGTRSTDTRVRGPRAAGGRTVGFPALPAVPHRGHGGCFLRPCTRTDTYRTPRRDF